MLAGQMLALAIDYDPDRFLDHPLIRLLSQPLFWAVLGVVFGPSDGPCADEFCIKPGDTIFVLGTLCENRWARKGAGEEANSLSRIGPGFVSPAEADLQQQFLGRGLAWVGTVASESGFDLHPPVILMQGNGPFVISTDSQREIVSKLHWKSLLYIWGGPVVALWGLWEILSRAKALGLLPGISN